MCTQQTWIPAQSLQTLTGCSDPPCQFVVLSSTHVTNNSTNLVEPLWGQG